MFQTVSLVWNLTCHASWCSEFCLLVKTFLKIAMCIEQLKAFFVIEKEWFIQTQKKINFRTWKFCSSLFYIIILTKGFPKSGLCNQYVKLAFLCNSKTRSFPINYHNLSNSHQYYIQLSFLGKGIHLPIYLGWDHFNEYFERNPGKTQKY